MSSQSQWLYNFVGWLLFVASALFFIWASSRAGDVISLVASVIFLIACLVFIVPVWQTRPAKNQDSN